MANIHVPKPRVDYRYEPADDIDALQLARLLPVLIDIGHRTPLRGPLDGASFGMWIEGLPDELRRHFSPPRDAATSRRQ